jgi:hypothetical protein
LAAKISAVCWPFQWPLRPWSGKLEGANRSAAIANLNATLAFKRTPPDPEAARH